MANRPTRKEMAEIILSSGKYNENDKRWRLVPDLVSTGYKPGGGSMVRPGNDWNSDIRHMEYNPKTKAVTVTMYVQGDDNDRDVIVDYDDFARRGEYSRREQGLNGYRRGGDTVVRYDDEDKDRVLGAFLSAHRRIQNERKSTNTAQSSNARTAAKGNSVH